MKKGEQTNCLKIGVTEVRSKILTPLETTGGNSFSQEGFEKMFFKTLRRVNYIPLKGFRYLSWGYKIPLEGFRYLSRGYKIPLEGFRFLSRGYKIPQEGFRYLS